MVPMTSLSPCACRQSTSYSAHLAVSTPCTRLLAGRRSSPRSSSARFFSRLLACRLLAVAPCPRLTSSPSARASPRCTLSSPDVFPVGSRFCSASRRSASCRCASFYFVPQPRESRPRALRASRWTSPLGARRLILLGTVAPPSPSRPSARAPRPPIPPRSTSPPALVGSFSSAASPQLVRVT